MSNVIMKILCNLPYIHVQGVEKKDIYLSILIILYGKKDFFTHFISSVTELPLTLDKEEGGKSCP